MSPIRVVLLFLMACSLVAVAAEEAKAKVEEQAKRLKGPAVIELTSRTFGSSMSDGSVWLVEFYAPWCGHCRTFAPSYEEVAQTLHGLEGDRKIKVGKVNGDKERGIASRFGVNAFPSFYLVDGWSVYEFDGSRSAPKLVDFAKSGYKELEPLPFWSSPMGPMGLLQGLLIRGGTMFIDVYEWMTKEKGMSPVMVVCVVICGGIFFSIFSMICLTILLSSKPKED